MTTRCGTPEIDRFRTIVAGRLGLHFDDYRVEQLSDVLERRLRATALGPDPYLARLASSGFEAELDVLAEALTVTETYFFRHFSQYRALVGDVLPELLRGAAPRRTVRLLSAGCASGEEAYSLAILIRDALPDPSWPVSVLGIDLNGAALARAERGRFSEWSLRDTPEYLRERWFRPDGREFVLDDRIRQSVRFERQNLAADVPRLWLPDSYDVVFFRNVLMYWTREVAAAVVGRMAGALGSGGFLFLGHAETLRGLSNDFHVRQTSDAFYYQRRDAVSVSPEFARTRLLTSGTTVAERIDDLQPDWPDAIGRAAERIAAMAERRSPQGDDARPSLPDGRSSTPDLAVVLERLRQERFTEALDLLDRIPKRATGETTVLLLRAALLTQCGRLAEAEATCRQLLVHDGLSAGAHYLLALCCEGHADRAGAIHHHQVAVYLDPGFAMPRLHLGLLARRAGEHAAARKDLAQAHALLQRGDPSRLLLFGGGFSRDTLGALCRAELEACGGGR